MFSFSSRIKDFLGRTPIITVVSFNEGMDDIVLYYKISPILDNFLMLRSPVETLEQLSRKLNKKAKIVSQAQAFKIQMYYLSMLYKKYDIVVPGLLSLR